MGRQLERNFLSPLLKTGVTLANFNKLGKTACEKKHLLFSILDRKFGALQISKLKQEYCLYLKKLILILILYGNIHWG